jgi:hypothetical protein
MFFIRAVLLLALQAPTADNQTLSPLVYLFDTGSASARPLDAATLRDRHGWQVLPEDELKHEFRGDAVLLNDKLAVVLRRQGHGAEVYATAPTGIVPRLAVAPQAKPSSKPNALAAIGILENGPSAGAMEATFRMADGSRASLTYRLTTGQLLLELRPGENSRQVVVEGFAQHVVVPDFFGDDVVLSGHSLSGLLPSGKHARGGRAGIPRQPRIGVPAENYFVNLADHGRAMLMCVWPSPRQCAELLLSGEAEPRIAGFEIACSEEQKQPIWLALIEGAGLWYERPLGSEAKTTLDWRPPFPAKWRADFVRTLGIAQSCYFHNGEGAGDEEPATGQPCPCHFEGDRPVVDRLSDRKSALQSSDALVVYPIDRTPATPLTAFCPIDVLRNTLGVGPCQYILQTEGLAVEGDPTPANVMNWIEKQFDKRKDRKAADDIRQLLGQMTEHARHAQKRIEHYAAAAREIQALLPAQQPGRSDNSATTSLGGTTAYLQEALRAEGVPGAAARSAELAARVVAMIGREDGAAECRRLGIELRAVGSLQDRTLAKCRMGLRWLREQTRLLAVGEPQEAEWAIKIQSRVRQALEVPSPQSR